MPSGSGSGATRYGSRAFLLLGAVFLTTTLALATVLVVSEYRSAAAYAQNRALSAAQLLATQFKWVFDASDQTLRRIDAAVDRNNLVRSFQAIAQISEADPNLPAGFQYAVYDANGRLAYSSVPNAPSTTISDRAYFRLLSDGREMTTIAPMLMDRASGANVFVIARRLESRGEFAGVASVAVPVQNLEAVAATLGFTEGSTVSLVKMDGELLARAPPSNPMNLSGAPVFEHLRKAESGVYRSGSSPADGQPRVVGYWRVPGWPVVALAGLHTAQAMADFWRTMGTWALIAVPVLLALAGAIWRLFLMARTDMQRQKLISQANERNEFLLREVHHRVKNNLQTVMSLIRLQQLPEQERLSLLGRIEAMAAVHEEMYQSDRLEMLEVAPFLDRLVRKTAEGYGARSQIVLDVDPLQLSGDRATQLGLVVNELVSNAFKHGLGPGKGGKLIVRLRRSGSDAAILEVIDDGPGYDSSLSGNMGARLITGFMRQLGGEYTVRTDEGVAFRASIPLTGEAAG